jgi:metal-sulfur cluster biosynthetic enzyme
VLSAAASRVAVRITPTNEECLMAQLVQQHLLTGEDKVI